MEKTFKIVIKYKYINTFKYHVFAPMGRFQLELDLNSNCQLPKPGDRSDFNTHKKLILTEIFPSVQKHDI